MTQYSTYFEADLGIRRGRETAQSSLRPFPSSFLTSSTSPRLASISLRQSADRNITRDDGMQASELGPEVVRGEHDCSQPEAGCRRSSAQEISDWEVTGAAQQLPLHQEAVCGVLLAGTGGGGV